MNRIALRSAMTVVLLLVMNYRFTDNQAHEIAGLLLAALFFVHATQNRRWYTALWAGWRTPSRAICHLVNLLLTVLILTVLVTGVLISQTVFNWHGLRGAMLAHELHMSAAYAGFMLTATHIGLHWEAMMDCLRRRLPA